jgi:shikimate kinase
VHISLIGLPGSGKSTIGRHVAKVWKMDFVDTDHVIEQRLGCSIKTFFEAQGEAAFRDIETEVLRDLLDASTPAVLSTGGGVVLREANRRALHAQSSVFYLQSLPEDIARRLRSDTTRPLMQGDDPLKRLRQLLQVRSPLYLETAHYVIDAAWKNTSQVSRKICMQAELAGLVADRDQPPAELQ